MMKPTKYNMTSRTFNRNEDNFTHRYVVITTTTLKTLIILIMLENYAFKPATLSVFHAHMTVKDVDQQGATSTLSNLNHHDDNSTLRYVVAHITMIAFFTMNTHFTKSSPSSIFHAPWNGNFRLMNKRNIEGATSKQTNSAFDNYCSLSSKHKLSAAAGGLPFSLKTNVSPYRTRGKLVFKTAKIIAKSTSRTPPNDPGSPSTLLKGEYLFKRFYSP